MVTFKAQAMFPPPLSDKYFVVFVRFLVVYTTVLGKVNQMFKTSVTYRYLGSDMLHLRGFCDSNKAMDFARSLENQVKFVSVAIPFGSMEMVITLKVRNGAIEN